MTNIGTGTQNAGRSVTVTIRRADAGDIPHLAHVLLEATGGLYEALYEEVIPDRPTNQIIEHLLSRGNATTCVENCWVAELDGKIAGASRPIQSMTKRMTHPILYFPKNG